MRHYTSSGYATDWFTKPIVDRNKNLSVLNFKFCDMLFYINGLCNWFFNHNFHSIAIYFTTDLALLSWQLAKPLTKIYIKKLGFRYCCYVNCSFKSNFEANVLQKEFQVQFFHVCMTSQKMLAPQILNGRISSYVWRHSLSSMMTSHEF